MIRQLVRIELESYFHDVVVWGGRVFPVLVLFFSFMEALGSDALAGLSFSDILSRVFVLSVGLSSVLVAIKVSRRNAVEKRTRLFSQLPVSTREVSVASWYVRLLCLSVPVLACTIVLARATDMPFAVFPLVTLATYLGATTLVAAISVAMSIPHLPSPMSSWAKGIYALCAVIAFLVWLIGNLLVSPYGARRGGVNPAFGNLEGMGLAGLTGWLMVSSVGLVVLDIWLRDRADDYLG
jgi:hypothetical protein